MYKVLEYFTDLQDNDYAYSVGDIYPRKGLRPTEERIKELAGNINARKRPVIKAETEAVETFAAEETTIEDNTKVEEKPKRSRKKKTD